MKEKINYDKKLSEIIKSLDKKPKLLLHSCCGPCSSYVITYLSLYFDITILYYNPNIEPDTEYEKRKQTQLELIDKLKLKNVTFMDIEYSNLDFKNISKNHENDKEGGIRCHLCYDLRLTKTAMLASENNFDYFCTTLTVSPYKNSEKINEIGEKIGNYYNVKWLYSDFKKKDGYKKSIELSKKYNLYRQNYCGCMFCSNLKKE